jgi:hypothetical protein
MATPAASSVKPNTINITRMEVTLSNGSVYVGYTFGTPKLTKRGSEKIRMFTAKFAFREPKDKDIDYVVARAWKSHTKKKIQWTPFRPASLKTITEEETLKDIEAAEKAQEQKELAELNRMQLLITQEYPGL